MKEQFGYSAIRKLRPIDDAFFANLAKKEEVCEEILRVILGDKKLRVKTVSVQDSIVNLHGRSVRLDALCELGDGRLCNVEVQRSKYGNHFKRLRYYRITAGKPTA